ncbi:tyrosine-type recombinase/integrase [Mitsuaria sp. WAJ17]|uniref:tyrosine-type recombinase/integrase n=1 Tax=Mitsuaria sp. WAJ17 TaxID=2761452 RepID=UPI002872FF55|nr:tyrosine-type recombinase/integrase [Mitsuaria sp. WAJ17]
MAAGAGLYLEVKPNGSKLWRWKYRLLGKENRYALGSYPALPLKEAREAVEAARKLVMKGIHPTQQKKLDRLQIGVEHANTFEVIAREWVGFRDWEEVTKKRRLNMLERVVFPYIGSMPAKQITPVHILDILKRADKQNGNSVAWEAKRTMSAVFEFAVSTLRAAADPVYPVRKALVANKTQHKRPLSSSDIGQLLADVDGHGGNYQTQCAFNLMWLTLARPSEVIEAEWAEFDLDAAIWRIPAERMKKRKEHLIPLPQQAVALLRSMHPISGSRKHVFPHRDERSKPMVTASFRQMLNALSWAGKFSPHATRTTGSTRLNEMGYSADWIERQLAHEEPNSVRRTYNHADYFKDRADMMQQWANLLDQWKQAAIKAASAESPATAPEGGTSQPQQ